MKQKPPPQLSNGQKRFCCTVASCCSRDGQPKVFTSQKLLTQHFIKVHAEKKYACSKCGKKFGAEWLAKHHEATCGTSWLCSCSATYQNREALLTHARRHSHTLPFELKRGDAQRRKQLSNQSVQPIIVPVATQVIILVQSPKDNATGPRDSGTSSPTKTPSQWRSIVPKANPSSDLPSSGLDTLPVKKVHQGCQTTVSCRCKRTKDSCTQACTKQASTRDACEFVNLPPRPFRRPRAVKRAVETQTCELDVQYKASQPRLSRAWNYNAPHGCSIHTQTIESAVCRIQNTRARHPVIRPGPRKLDKEIATNELWGDLDQIFFNGPATPAKEWMDIFPRSSSGTQTLESDALLKELCSSYTSSRSPFIDGSRENLAHLSLSTVSLEQGLGVISRKPAMLPVLAPICEPEVSSCLADSLQHVSHILSTETQTDNLLDSFFLDDVQQTAAQTDFPSCSHNETQTSEDVSFEGADVFHMETQTSGFLFCDFEGVDIETQTPWDHLDFSLDDFVVEPSFTNKKDAESQIEDHQLVWPRPCLKPPEGERLKDCSNMQTQTSGLI